MSQTRGDHTATLLPGGKVLVAGGVSSAYLSSAELYDPSTGTWSSTSAMSQARGYHTATLLPSGKVLVAGGYNYSSGYLSSAELYDPSTGTWSSTGAMSQARYSPTATLLPSGKVLVAGGYGSGVYLSGAELYDPSTGTWSSTGAMSQGRGHHTANLLPSGQVLVAGGVSSAYLSSAELYDPSTGSWSSTGAMSQARAYHAATLLPSGQVLVAGGSGSSGTLSSAELYNPSTGSWVSTGAMSQARDFPTATLLPSDQVLVVGGIGGSDSAELYNPSTGTWSWSSTDAMSQARKQHTATLLPSGQVLVAGGYYYDRNTTSNVYLSSAELYLGFSITTTPTNVTSSSATLNGIVSTTSVTGNTTVRFEFGTTTAYGMIITATPGSISANVSSTTVTGNVLALSQCTIYHYRIKAVNAGVTYPGIDVSFRTLGCFPSPIVTNPATDVTLKSATLNGSVTPNDASTNVTFDYGLTTNYGSNVPATPSPINAGPNSVPVTAAVAGLICNTTYHYRVKATNSNGTSMGDDQSFITATCPPTPCGDACLPNRGGWRSALKAPKIHNY